MSRAVLLLAVLLAAAPAAAQSSPHLQIAASAGTAANGRLSLVVDVKPRAGIHVYAPGASDYLVVTLNVTEQPGIRAAETMYPPSEIYHFEPLDERIPVYQKPFRLVREVVLTAPAQGRDRLTIAGTLEYQACDDRICFRPVSVPLTWAVTPAASAAQPAPAAQRVDLTRQVRAAIAKQDLAGAAQMVARARAAGGPSTEVLQAMSWLGRGALATGQLDAAYEHASETFDLAAEAAKTTRLSADSRLEIALGAAIEVMAQVRAARGERSDAVYFLQRQLEAYGDTPIHKRIQKNINLLSLEGQRAPALERGDVLGRPVPAAGETKGKVVLLFFWAHWCPDCKAQSPIVARLLENYRSRGLTVIAPTQRFGTIGSRKVTAEEEFRHITQVRDESYAFLRDEAAPVSEANMKRYGVSTTPTLALVDRQGIVRLYRPGNMPEEQLDAAIARLLE